MARYDYLNNYLNSSMNKYNNGGMFTSYNVGGTHEENPNGGIPLGDDALVEQGETSVNLDEQGAPTKQDSGSKYIFSDRQVWTPEDMKAVGLPATRKPVTAGEYMAKLNEKFKDKAGSKADKETLDAFTKRATKLAEDKRMQQEQLERAMQMNSQQIAPENTEVPEGMEEFAGGGLQNDFGSMSADAEDVDAPTNGMLSGAGSYIKAAGTAFDLYKSAKEGNTSPKKGNAILGGAAQGAMAGASFGLYGALAGAIYGGATGYFGAEEAQKNIAEAQGKAATAVNSGMPNASAWTGMAGPAPRGVVSAMGGYITSQPAKYDKGGPINPPATRQDSLNLYNNSRNVENFYRKEKYKDS